MSFEITNEVVYNMCKDNSLNILPSVAAACRMLRMAGTHKNENMGSTKHGCAGCGGRAYFQEMYQMNPDMLYNNAKMIISRMAKMESTVIKKKYNADKLIVKYKDGDKSVTVEID